MPRQTLPDASGSFSSPFGVKPIHWRRHPLEPLVRIPDAAADLSARGVAPADPVRAAHLEGIARRFIAGCNAMYLDAPLDRLAALLDETPPERQGFVAEGAAMGAAIRDSLSLSDRLFPALRAGYGARFDYLLTVGAGWAVARTPWREGRLRRSIDPRHVPLICDGRGFHDLYFHPEKAAAGRVARYRGSLARGYDAGIGRALWFVGSGNAEKVRQLVGAFPAARQGDLMAGLGLAMSYAGPAGPDDWDAILGGRETLRPALGQGICFAAEALRQGGCQPENLAIACQTVLGLSPDAAAAIARTAKPAAGPKGAAAVAAYENWRADIRRVLDPAGAAAPDRSR